MTPEAWKEQAAHTVSESGAASDWEHALKIGADLYPLVQQAIAAECERCAKVIEDNQETWVGGGKAFLEPRTEGSRTGLAFAAAIRSLREPDNGA